MKDYCAYYRVSTKRQVVSGLGLDAQRQIVHSYIHQKGRLIQEYVEQESGKNDQRVELAKALNTCRDVNAILVIAKLDRLSRSVSFISKLLESRVKFIACDIPDCNELTIHIFSAMAEFELKRISERIVNALQAKRIREPNYKHGRNNLTKEVIQKGHESISMKAKTDQSVIYAYHYICLLKQQELSYQQIADILNKENYRTRTGCMFHPQQVWNIVQRFEDKQSPLKQADCHKIDIN